jgi:hypothetical protein
MVRRRALRTLQVAMTRDSLTIHYSPFTTHYSISFPLFESPVQVIVFP